MAIVYRTNGAWGTGKGSNLAPAEIDGNFYNIDSRVTYIEDNPVMPIEPISITITGYNFFMGLSNGETLGPVVMTMPVPEWRGAWTPATIYHDMDFITAPDGGFGAVMLGHTSAATFDWAAVSGDGLPLYRQIVGANAMTVALSDLTDVALAGIATGDMLVWDGASSYWRNLDAAEVAEQLAVFAGDTGTGGARGMVPAPAAGDAAAHKFLSASGGWVVPATGSGGSASLAGLTDVSINSPVNDSLLQYKAGDGKWHNSSIMDLGAGTVTSVTAGSGLSGGTITSTGTIALAAAPAATMLANTAGGSAPPAPATLTVALDALAGSIRGSLLQRNAVGWQPLAPGTAGLFLRTGGTGADLTWASPAGNGTVTSITAGAGLSGGTITTAGTIALAAIADVRMLANVSGAGAPPTATSVTALLDAALGTTRGSVIRRDGSVWSALAPGTAGHVLTSGGSGADVSWAPGGGSGASVSVGDAPPASPDPGALWWDSAGGQLYLRYDDGNSSQWVPASNMPGPQGPTGATGPAGQTWTVGAGLTLSANTISLTTPALPLTGGTLSGSLTVNNSVGSNGSNAGYTWEPRDAPGTVWLMYAAAGTMRLWRGGDALLLSPSGILTLAGSLTVDSAAQVTLTAAGGYTTLKAPTTGGSIVLGGTSAIYNYYINTNHTFRNLSALDTMLLDGSGNLTIAGGTATKPGGGSWVAPSDIRLKRDVTEYTGGLAQVLALRPITYGYNGKGGLPDDGRSYVGLDAGETEPVMPELVGSMMVTLDPVSTDEFPPTEVKEPDTEVKTIDASALVYALVNAVKELTVRIAALEAKTP
jgi:hypothetical protein